MIADQKAWDSWVEKNKSAYGKACVDVARRVMAILDEEYSKDAKDVKDDFDCYDLICRADDDVKAGGITGFMAGCVASMVRRCHSRGEEFGVKWNLSYGVAPKKASHGTVNPAILTIKLKQGEL